MKESQKTRVLNELLKGDWFSLASALNMSPPVYRLSERIREIERMGYDIEHRRVAGKTFEEYKIHTTIEPLRAEKEKEITIAGKSYPIFKEKKEVAEKQTKLI
jgi:hypothetical protein